MASTETRATRTADASCVDLVDADGRKARRNRNKVRVADAFLDLVREGATHPSVADVAERSGVSHRSVFRYFADRDEMTRTSIERQHSRLDPILHRRIDPIQALADRVDQVIDHRLELFEEIAATARLTRSLARRQPMLQTELTATRSRLRVGLKRLFAAEFATMPPSIAADTLATLDVLLSFESVELLRHDQMLSHARSARVLRRATIALLGATE